MQKKMVYVINPPKALCVTALTCEILIEILVMFFHGDINKSHIFHWNINKQVSFILAICWFSFNIHNVWKTISDDYYLEILSYTRLGTTLNFRNNALVADDTYM